MLEETPITDDLHVETNNPEQEPAQSEADVPQDIHEAHVHAESTTDAQQDPLAELKDKHLRLMAEFDNFRRRTAKEKTELRAIAGRDTIIAFLPAIDDFDRAEANGEIATDGIRLVYHKLHQILKSCGVEAMQSTGLDFDPNCHEAITEISAPNNDLKGKVIDTIEPGYLLNGQIIRFAKVVVGA
jgi:molecular chaperone GrpE